MPLDLAALLVEAAAVSAEDVERALARQREAGGALDTALLELGLVAEGELIRFLSRAAGLPPAPGGTIEADPRARRVFPARVAERHGLAPFRLDGRELSLVAAHPVDLAAIDEISFMLSLHLVPHVTTEWRVRELLARVYGMDLEPRFAALAEVLRAREPDEATARAAAAREDPSGERADATPPARARSSGWDLGRADPEDPLATAVARAVEALDAATFLRDLVEPDPIPEEPPGWSIEDACRALDAAGDRDEVVGALLRYTREFLDSAALFAVTRERVKGVDAVGWPDARARCHAAQLRPEDAGVLRTAITTRAPYLGPVAREPGNERLLAALGRRWPAAAVACPVVLRERVVCVLYGDNGEAPISARRVGDLLLVAGSAAAALERVLHAVKAARNAAPAAPAGGAGGWDRREPERGADSPAPAAPPEEPYRVVPLAEALPRDEDPGGESGAADDRPDRT